MIRVSCELGADCLWVVTEDSLVGQFHRRAFYPWEADLLADEHAEADWVAEALDHLTAISGAGEE
jgi:hypothetical protein